MNGLQAYWTCYLRLYTETEDAASTKTFTDFFPADGKLTVLVRTAVGAAKIVELKQSLLPTDGSKKWNHNPNVTTLYSDSAASKVYLVLGAIESTQNGKCTKA